MTTEAQIQHVIPRGVEQLVVKLQDAFTPHYDHQNDWFAWQSLPMTDFYKGMSMVRDKLGEGRHKFVDVGSGIGVKLFLADTLGFEPYGIERDARYIEVCQQLFPEYAEHNVYHADALEFTRYDVFDVIYSFRIARDEDLQRKLNDHIVEHMKDEAIFFLNDTTQTLESLGTSGNV